MIDRTYFTFYMVARHKSFTKAAQSLYLTQPAVSQQIKALEEKHSVKLFLKEGKRIKLTPEGEVLYRYAKMIINATNSLQKDIINSSLLTKLYHIGATLTIGEYLLPPLLGLYKKELPLYDITVEVANTNKIKNEIFENKLDLGLIEGTFDKNIFKHKLFMEDELILVAGIDSELAETGVITADQLPNIRLILREKGSGTRQAFENALIKEGFEAERIKPYMCIGSLTSIKSMVESNLGYTVISKLAVERELKDEKLKHIKINNFKITREFNFIYMKTGPQKFINEFINYCFDWERSKREYKIR